MQADLEESNEYGLFMMESKGGQKPFPVDVELDGGLLQMEIDTGAAFSMVSEATF